MIGIEHPKLRVDMQIERNGESEKWCWLFWNWCGIWWGTRESVGWVL